MKHIATNNFSSDKIEKYSDQFISNSPFPHMIIDNFLKIDSSNKILNNFNFNRHWNNYSLINNRKHWGLTDQKKMDENCNELFDELGSEEFVNLLSKITGIKGVFLDKTLDASGLFQVFNGGRCSMHTDFNSHTIEKKWRRVLNILIYFNKDWLDEYNGQLEFWDENLKHKVKSISPIFNRCLIFRTDKKSYHGYPEKINIPSKMSRKSLAAWYFVEEDKELELYPTKYRPRPNDSFFYGFLIHIDTFLNKIFAFLKRYHILNDKIASKVLGLFK